MSERELSVQESKMKEVMSWVVLVILLLFGLVLLNTLYRMTNQEDNFWLNMVEQQFPVLVGLPMAGMASLFVTLLLRMYSGPMEFEAAGIKFRGSSGPIVFWVFCFLVITLAIKLLWIPV